MKPFRLMAEGFLFFACGVIFSLGFFPQSVHDFFHSNGGKCSIVIEKDNSSFLVSQVKEACRQQVTLSPEAARRFFKPLKGRKEWNDAFLGVTVPDLRKIAIKYEEMGLPDIAELLQSPYNEERLLALFILVRQYQKKDQKREKEICAFYLNHLDRVNNWNLVDASAYLILGHYLWDKDKIVLVELALSDCVWRRRVAIVATLFFIRQAELEWTFKIALLLQEDSQDLIHKAVGWMLREAGKKDEGKLMAFLSEYAHKMPKTMLRYAMERLSLEQKISIRK